MTGVDFEGNGPSPDAWGVVAEGEASLAQYIVIKETVDGPVRSLRRTRVVPRPVCYRAMEAEVCAPTDMLG